MNHNLYMFLNAFARVFYAATGSLRPGTEYCLIPCLVALIRYKRVSGSDSNTGYPFFQHLTALSPGNNCFRDTPLLLACDSNYYPAKGR